MSTGYAHRRRFITLHTPDDSQADLEVPGDQPLGALLPDLVKVLALPEQAYDLWLESGLRLGVDETLISAGVENSDSLWLRPGAGEAEGESIRRRATAPEPAPAGVPAPGPVLASPNGLLYVIGKPPVRIGRPDREARPEIDLTDLEAQLARPLSSRRHAEIVSAPEGLALRALPAANGTFANGVELAAGQVRPLRTGDVLEFGFQGVKLTFYEAGALIPPEFFLAVV